MLKICPKIYKCKPSLSGGWPGGVRSCSSGKREGGLCCCRECYGKQEGTETGAFFSVAQKRTKRGSFVAVNAANCDEGLYRRQPFLGGQRCTLACGAHSAPWKTRKMTREKACFFPWHLSSFSFTQELTWRRKPTSRKLFGFCCQQNRGLGVQGALLPGSGVWGPKRPPSFSVADEARRSPQPKRACQRQREGDD